MLLVHGFCGEPPSFKDIGKIVFGVDKPEISRQRANEIYHAAINKLKINLSTRFPRLAEQNVIDLSERAREQ